jgi:hypothetical protein
MVAFSRSVVAAMLELVDEADRQRVESLVTSQAAP